MNNLLDVLSVSKHFNGVEAVTDVTLSVQEGSVLGVIGPNGAGKTTLFDIITGYVTPDKGCVNFRGMRVLGRPPHEIAALRIARTFQNLRLAHSMTVLDNVMLWCPPKTALSVAASLFRRRREIMIEAEHKASALGLLREVGLDQVADSLAGDLSYGQQKLLSLVCCNAASADLCLLDEPVAGLSSMMASVVVSQLRTWRSRGRSVMLIEHNIDVVMEICDRVAFMDAGCLVCEGTPSCVRNDHRVIEAYLE